MLQTLSRYEFAKAVKETKSERHSEDFPPGVISSRCYLVSSPARTVCGVLKPGWPPRATRFIISVLNPCGDRLSLMPMSIGLTSFLKKSSSGCCPNVYPWRPSTNSGSRILSKVWMRRSLICVCRFLTGRSSGRPKGRWNCMWNWTTRVIFRHSFTWRQARNMSRKSLGWFPWRGAT